MIYMFKNQYGGGGYSQDILDKIKKIISMGSTKSTKNSRCFADSLYYL